MTTRAEIPPILLGELLGPSCVEIAAPGLWKVLDASLREQLLTLAGAEAPAAEGPVWLRLAPDLEPPEDLPVLDLALPEGLRFQAPPFDPEVGELTALAAHLPGDLVSSTPVVLYRPPEEGTEPDPEAPFDVLPRAGSAMRVPAGVTPAWLVPETRLRCAVSVDGREWTVEVAFDPARPGEALALCPACDAPVDRWYRCDVHGPHCGNHRKVCRSCRRGECADCFALACGSCDIPLCPECAEPPCPSGDHGSCANHRTECGECHRTHCLACGAGTCAVGDDPLCKECAGTCAACGRVARGRLLTPCFGCQEATCPECGLVCHLDGRMMCPAHGVTCPTCSRPVCEGHRAACPSCGKVHCRMHLEPCGRCARPSCPACLGPAGCAQCRSVREADPTSLAALDALGAGRAWARYSSARASKGPLGWLFVLGVGLAEYRVSTDPDLSRIESEHRRGPLQRMLNR